MVDFHDFVDILLEQETVMKINLLFGYLDGLVTFHFAVKQFSETFDSPEVVGDFAS